MAIVGVIAFGMTMVIIGGEIDLSVGSSIALSAVLTALISNNLAAGGMSPDLALVLSIIIALVIGIGIGAFNGFIRTKFNIPTFIITLAMLNVLYGIAAVISNGFRLRSQRHGTASSVRGSCLPVTVSQESQFRQSGSLRCL